MRAVDLTFDKTRHLFSLPVTLLRKPEPTFGGPANPPYIYRSMYLDTGSNLTSITDKEASGLGINPERLRVEDVGGIGGMTRVPITHDVIIVVLDRNQNPAEIRLDNIGVHRTEIKRKIEKTHGVFKEKGYVGAQMVCLFGLDAVEKLKGKIELDMVSKKGEIQFTT
jgi:hypothetical protein